MSSDSSWFYLSTGSRRFDKNRCIEDGAYLASIHSQYDVNKIGNLCGGYQLNDDSTCWIAIEVDTCHSDNNFTLKWIDNTIMNYSNIKWDDGYPLNLCHNQSFIYFDATEPDNYCLKNGYDKPRMAICGNPFKCVWSSNLISYEIWLMVAFIISIIVSIMAGIAFKVYCNHLYCKRYNYLSHHKLSKLMKVTTVLYPAIQVMLYSIIWTFLLSVFTLCENNTIHSTNWHYLWETQRSMAILGISFQSMVVILFAISFALLFPLHVTLRLRNTLQKNEIMHEALLSNKCKHFFYFMYIMIIIQVSMIFIGAIITAKQNWLATTGQWAHSIYPKLLIVITVLFGIMDSTIHLLLLYMYTKGLFEYTKYLFRKNFKNKYNDINNKMHEEMIEASRYTVLFGSYAVIVLIMNLFIATLQLIINNNWIKHVGFYGNIFYLVYIVVRDIMSINALFLSFRFAHKWYEKPMICGKCDKSMKEYCRKKALKIDTLKNGNMISLISPSNGIIKDSKTKPLLNDDAFL